MTDINTLGQRADAATAELLIELAFLVPSGTDFKTHPIAKALINHTRAVVAEAVAAKIAESCGQCAHADHECYDDPTLIGCTHAKSFYHGKAMQATAKCEKWEAK